MEKKEITTKVSGVIAARSALHAAATENAEGDKVTLPVLDQFISEDLPSFKPRTT